MPLRLTASLFLALLLAACAQVDAPEPTGEGAAAPAEMPASEPMNTDATAAIPPPAPAPAETMVPEPASMASEYTVFFAFNSALLSSEAEAVIDQAVAAAAAKGSEAFTVSGFADPIGSRSQNETMSRWRAQAVADELIFRGVSPTSIQTDWFGTEGADASSSPDQGNRRVVIQLR